MSKQNQTQHNQVSEQAQAKSANLETKPIETAVPSPIPSRQRIYTDPRTLTSANVYTLQRTIGNQTLGRLIIQRKMTVGPVGDKYEQEADAVAKQVVGKLHASPAQTTTPAKSTQRQEEKEAVQMKPLPTISSLQRQEEELQAKGDAILTGGELSGDIESSVQSAKSGGQPISDNIRGPMENAFNADFSSVKVHTGSQSDNLNRSLSARAFTSGQDVFFRSGEYNPSSSGGQELLAHELTHVVQQNGGTMQRKPQHIPTGKINDSQLQVNERYEAANIIQPYGHERVKGQDGYFVPSMTAAIHCHVGGKMRQPHLKIQGTEYAWGVGKGVERRMNAAYEALVNGANENLEGYADCKEYLEEQGCTLAPVAPIPTLIEIGLQQDQYPPKLKRGQQFMAEDGSIHTA